MSEELALSPVCRRLDELKATPIFGIWPFPYAVCSRCPYLKSCAPGRGVLGIREQQKRDDDESDRRAQQRLVGLGLG